MYSHDRNYFLRHFLRAQALAKESSVKHTSYDPSQMPELIMVFDTEKMHDMLNKHDRKSRRPP